MRMWSMSILAGAILLCLVAVAAVRGVAVDPPPTRTPAPTPWGTPPWADRWTEWGCVGSGSEKVCYPLPPADVADEICAAALVWGLPGCQVTRCLYLHYCLVEVSQDNGRRACYFARWYPRGHPDWPQGGWAFPQRYMGDCSPAPGAPRRPALPFGTSTPPPKGEGQGQ